MPPSTPTVAAAATALAAAAITHASFTIERTYPVSPERTFAAFADPDLKARWMSGLGRSSTGDHAMDFRVGGMEVREYRMAGGPLPDGTVIRNDTVYLDIVPHHRIVFSYTMAVNGYRMSASLATVEILPEGNGTRLVFTEQGAFFEHSDGPAMRENGWGEILNRLGAELSA